MKDSNAEPSAGTKIERLLMVLLAVVSALFFAWSFTL